MVVNCDGGKSMFDSHSVMANAIRLLSVDAIYKAASGHPGMPLGMADAVTVLFANFMKFSVENPNWIDRDRFVLSNGHGSMLIYSVLHLLGYIGLEDIKNFRQLHSITPGHPEYGCTPGIEVTTGPLGQGLGCAVGLAIAERALAERFGEDIVSHYTYAVVGDGCLMEGISHEAASLAGHLGLGKLIVLFDDNGISIDGSTELATSDNVLTRFNSYGWDTWEVDGHDYEQVYAAIENSRETNKPSIIACKTVIGKFMSSKEGTSSAHSWPFTEKDVEDVRRALGCQTTVAFEVGEEAKVLWGGVRESAEEKYRSWREECNKRGDFAELTEEFNRGLAEDILSGLDELKKSFCDARYSEATRKSFGRVLEFLSSKTHKFIGGSADLSSSNNTKSSSMTPISKNKFRGTYMHYGVREHAMAACMNGMALHGGIIPYGGTFLVFSDYCRPAIRLSALMGVQVIYVMTHDSIGVGEDGPTHQPIEHLASLRAIPNLYLFRPADAVEVLECWDIALRVTDAPSMFVLSRQGVQSIRDGYSNENLSGKGAYILCDASGDHRVTIMATGSEVGIAFSARDILQREHNIGVRVVSVPCNRIFDMQGKEYILRVLGKNVLRVAVEAACSMSWHKYIGEDGVFVGIDQFGASGKCEDLYVHFGITAEVLVNRVLEKLFPGA